MTTPDEPTDQELKWRFTVRDDNGNVVSGRHLLPGQRLVIESEGLPAGARIAVELHSTPIWLGAATAGEDGSLSLAVTLPEVVPPGAHELVATLTAPGYLPSVAKAAVEVDEPIELSGTISADPLDPAPAPEPVSTEPQDTRGFNDNHAGIADSLPTIFDVQIAPWKFAASGGLAAAFVLLAALPAELLESTLSENYGRAFRWLEPARRRVRKIQSRRLRLFNNQWLGSAFTVGVAAFILGFAEPDYGLTSSSLKTFVALFLSLYLLNVVVGAVKISVAKNRLTLPGRLIPMPGALVVAALSVLVSRVMHISPSLLFGLVVGVSFARIQSKEIEGKLALVGVSSILGLGLVSWLGFSLVEALSGDTTSFLPGLLEETLAATALESLSVLLVGLLPFTYLEGKALHDWDQRIWAATYFVCAAAFVFIAVPMGASWETSQEPVTTWLAICVGFAIISVGAWAAFRFIPDREPAREHESANS